MPFSRHLTKHPFLTFCVLKPLQKVHEMRNNFHLLQTLPWRTLLSAMIKSFHVFSWKLLLDLTAKHMCSNTSRSTLSPSRIWIPANVQWSLRSAKHKLAGPRKLLRTDTWRKANGLDPCSAGWARTTQTGELIDDNRHETRAEFNL